MEAQINILMEKVKDIQKNEGSGHDWWHTLRVYNNALSILNEMEAHCDENIVKISALLHDVADHKFGYSDTDCENKIKNLFKECKLDEKLLKKVTSIVNSISFSKNKEVTPIEAMVVQDADRLDAIGYIGIARTFTYGGYIGRPIYIDEKQNSNNEIYTLQHFEEKLFKLESLMNTEVARKKANERTKKMRVFVKGLISECEGLE